MRVEGGGVVLGREMGQVSVVQTDAPVQHNDDG